MNTHLCLNIKRFNERCIGQSPTTVSSSTRGLQSCSKSLFPIYTVTSTNHISIGIMHTSLALGSSPSTSSAHQRWPVCAHTPQFLQHNAAAFLISKGSSTAYHGGIRSLAFLLQAILKHSAVRPSCPLSMPDHSLVTDYHCSLNFAFFS